MIFRILTLLTSTCVLTVSQGQILDFTEVASAYGINYSFPTGSFGVGGSLYDFNSDGLDDISFGGEGAGALHFYTNTGSGFMTTNLPGAIIPESNINCLLWVDYDNDGDLDFSCNKVDEPMSLYRNDNGNYSDVGGQLGISSVSSYSYAGAWGDYNLDGALDHYAGNRDLNNLPNSNNRLFRSNGSGSSFTEVGATTFSQDGQGPAFAVVFTEYNKDGWPDLFIANDKFVTHNTLLENQSGSNFIDVSDSQSTGMSIDGMGVAPGDFDGNGYEDIYVTNTATNGPDFGGNILVRNNGDGTFNEMGGTLNLRVYEYGWGSSFADFDNDGDLDLFVANAMTWPIIDSSMINNLFINQGDGTFVEDTTTAMYDSYSSSYGCAVGDINNDGYPDILVMIADGTNLNLWQNNGGINNWVKFTLEGTTSNRMAVGSWIEVYNGTSVQHRYTRCGTSYGSQDGTATMFGLGGAAQIDSVKVIWPGGLQSMHYELGINQTHHLVEPSIITGSSLAQNYTMEIYPNPVSDELNLKTSAGTNSVTLRDQLGQRIHAVSVTKTNTGCKLNLENLESGVYFLMVEQPGISKVFKVIRL